MSAVPKDADYIAEADYLAGERQARERHEYVDGKVYAMAGASKRHSQMVLNIAFALRTAAQQAGCQVFSSDVKVRVVRRKAYYYPDVVVGCAADDVDEYWLEKPCLLVEVTSRSTEWKDYNEKMVAYQTLESLRGYLVVAQDQVQATLFYREEDGGWWVTAYESLEQAIPLPCPSGASLALVDVYDGVGITLPQPSQ